MRFTACEKCKGPVRVDDGSLINHKGEPCTHFGGPRERNVESVTTIFLGPDGKISIPWERNTPCPPGYVVEEVRGAQAVRKLEKELDQKDIKRYQQHKLKQEAIFGAQRAKRQEDLKQIVREGVAIHEGRTIKVSDFGRRIAQEKLDQLNKGGYSQNYDPGNHRRE